MDQKLISALVSLATVIIITLGHGVYTSLEKKIIDSAISQAIEQING